MTITLDRLGQSLSAQHMQLAEQCRSLPDGVTFWRSEQFTLDDVAATVFVNMSRTHLKHNIPEGAVICSFPRMVNHTAEVTIVPSNDKIKEVVANHFKNDTIPLCGMFCDAGKPVFDSVVIDNEVVIDRGKVI